MYMFLNGESTSTKVGSIFPLLYMDLETNNAAAGKDTSTTIELLLETVFST
jgi:hypothetical protein